MIRLRQSTASQEVPLGQFVDESDAKTPETGLTIANTDIKLHKAGATSLASKNSGGATHMSSGVYYCTLDATDTDTVGSLVLFVLVAGALPVRVECEVLPAAVYDADIAGTAYRRTKPYDMDASLAAALVDLIWDELKAGHAVAGSFGAYVDAAISGVSTGGVSASDIATAVRTELTTELGRIDAAVSSRSTYAGSDTAGTTTLLSRLTAGRATNLDNLDSPVSGVSTGGVSVGDIADAVWDEPRAGHVTAGTFGEGTPVASLPTDAVSAAALSAAAVDKILDEPVVGSTTMRQLLRGFAAALLGKASGLGTPTAKFRDPNDTKDVITASVDTSGNRTAVALDLT